MASATHVLLSNMEFGLVVSEGSGENAENNHEANHRTSLEVRCCIYSRLSTDCNLEVLLHVSQTYCLGGVACSVLWMERRFIIIA